MMPCLKTERGTALVVTVGLLFLITLMGFSAFRLSIDELGIAGNQKASVQAQYVAEAGAALILQWFQEPETFPDVGQFTPRDPAGGRRTFLAHRATDSHGAPSFFNDKGQSQFLGTVEEPDFWYRSGSDRAEFLGQAFSGSGALTSLKLFAPTSLGAIGTVEATGTTGSGISRTVSVELIPSPVPPTTAAVQIGSEVAGPVPILVHWGDVRVMGEADLGGSLAAIPKKDSTAPATGQPYSSSVRQDAWVDFYVGGSIVNPKAACTNCTEPFLSDGYGHLHQFQNANHSGFGLDRWDYQRLKTFAKTWGTYFGTDREGFLYLDGVFDSLHRLTPSQALVFQAAENRRRLVFIDTVDQKPPDGANLADLDLPIDYMEGLFSIQAHLTLRESGPGRSMEVRTPLLEGADDQSFRETVVLSGIHLKGVLSVAGRIAVEGRPNVFGALIAQQGFAGSGQPEVWYDAGLRTGYYPGLPTVTLLKGSWYIR